MDEFLDDGHLRRRAARRGGGRRARPGRPAAGRTPDRATEIALLRRMQRLGASARGPARRQGPRADHLPDRGLPPGRRHWTNERVVVFTEYRDTQSWLAELLRQEGLGGDRLALLHGGIAGRGAGAAQAGVPGRPHRPPGPHPARHRRRQRGHRPAEPLPPAGQLRHPVQPEPAGAAERPHRPARPAAQPRTSGTSSAPAGQTPVDAFEADLEFLSRVATKVAHDARTTSARSTPCSPTRCSGGCSARASTSTSTAADAGPQPAGPAGRHPTCATRSAGCAPTWTRPSRSCGITPPAVQRVVDTALELARQQPLRPHVDDRHADRRPLRRAAADRLLGARQRRAHREARRRRRAAAPAARHLRPAGRQPGPRRRRARPPQPPAGRHVDPAAARRRVQPRHRPAPGHRRGQRRPRAGGRAGRRVLPVRAGRRGRRPAARGGPLRRRVGAGAAAGSAAWRTSARSGGVLDRGADDRRARPPPDVQATARRALAAASPTAAVAAIEWRTKTRAAVAGAQAGPAAGGRAAADRRATSTSSPRTLRGALAPTTARPSTRCSAGSRRARPSEELAQYRRDRRSWEERLARSTPSATASSRRSTARYRDPQAHRFPVAVVFVVPKREAVR